jgi:hypothetical protein
MSPYCEGRDPACERRLEWGWIREKDCACSAFGAHIPIGGADSAARRGGFRFCPFQPDRLGGEVKTKKDDAGASGQKSAIRIQNHAWHPS